MWRKLYILSALAFPGNWTCDLGVASASLCHLSHTGTSLPAFLHPSFIMKSLASGFFCLFLLNYILCYNTYSRNYAVMIFISEPSLFALFSAITCLLLAKRKRKNMCMYDITVSTQCVGRNTLCRFNLSSPFLLSLKCTCIWSCRVSTALLLVQIYRVAQHTLTISSH